MYTEGQMILLILFNTSLILVFALCVLWFIHIIGRAISDRDLIGWLIRKWDSPFYVCIDYYYEKPNGRRVHEIIKYRKGDIVTIEQWPKNEWDRLPVVVSEEIRLERMGALNDRNTKEQTPYYRRNS